MRAAWPVPWVGKTRGGSAGASHPRANLPRRRSNRIVAGIYLTKLWNREKFTPAQAAAILARDNIAIHIFQDIQLTNEIWCRSDVTPNLSRAMENCPPGASRNCPLLG